MMKVKCLTNFGTWCVEGKTVIIGEATGKYALEHGLVELIERDVKYMRKKKNER